MIAMTTSSSISVKAAKKRRRMGVTSDRWTAKPTIIVTRAMRRMQVFRLLGGSCCLAAIAAALVQGTDQLAGLYLGQRTQACDAELLAGKGIRLQTAAAAQAADRFR